MKKKDRDPRIGARVELHPACDLWMRGARFGTVRAVKDGILLVRMDNPRIRKLQRFTPDLLKFEGSKGEYGLGYMQGRGAA